ncbi:MAG: enoyl-CoA hydratase/isomerase family protein [Chloroflexi bacterium]|nr:enoyl-CoA hydratase/isomerase family protein [Chloroflexota bacterium]
MPDLIYDKRDDYAIFTYNRPDRLNALGGQLINQLTEAIRDFTNDPKMRVGIVTGTGRAFSAGGDLKEMADGTFEGQFEATYPYSGNTKPFIAAINGLAVGGGLETALDCDIRICSTEAYFGLFEPKRGIMAGYATKHLARVIGLSAANYILLTADRIEPEQALKWGIVTEVLEPEALMPRAIEIAEMIIENAPLSVEGTKAQIQEWRLAKIDESIRLGQWVSKVVHASEDSKEGPKAFAEKRDPVWTAG